MTTGRAPHQTDAIRDALRSQYHAALTVLLRAVDACPPELWDSARHRNATWQVAYHTLFYAHLYLAQREDDFRAWEHHRPGYNRFPGSEAERAALRPYTQAEIRAYGICCQALVDAALPPLDLDAPESGFSWYTMPKLEHQLVNLRHIQHHAGQLAERLRQGADLASPWVGKGSAG